MILARRHLTALMLAALAAASHAQQAVTPPASAARQQASPSVTRPTWTELSPAQRQALAPLAPIWERLSEPHKRKWTVLAQNFHNLPPAEQAKLHSRMREWAALSPQQRSLARLNFGETQQVSPDEKKAKWEAYQALTPEEKRKLAAGAGPKPPTTAAAVKPVPADKLAPVPKADPNEPKPARIVVVPPGGDAPSN